MALSRRHLMISILFHLGVILLLIFFPWPSNRQEAKVETIQMVEPEALPAPVPETPKPPKAEIPKPEKQEIEVPEKPKPEKRKIITRPESKPRPEPKPVPKVKPTLRDKLKDLREEQKNKTATESDVKKKPGENDKTSSSTSTPG
jgi:outer membrane biosynthesis protein TonB